MRKEFMLTIRARITELRNILKTIDNISERSYTRQTLFKNIELLEELKGESNEN